MQQTAHHGASEANQAPALLSWKVPPDVPGSCRYVPPFPALPSTLVRLEILLQASAMDLRSAEAVLKRDPGFVAEILRLTGRRHLAPPNCLHECLVHLGVRSLSRAARIVPSWPSTLSGREIWRLRWRLKRARLTALAAEAISLALGDMSPEQAYLAGLLHDLPGMVCLNEKCSCKSPDCVPSVEAWNLPGYVVEAIRWHLRPGYSAPDHSSLVQRVAAARAWVDEVQLSDGCLPLGWFQKTSSKATWQHLPHRLEVLHMLADGFDHWWHSLAE